MQSSKVALISMFIIIIASSENCSNEDSLELHLSTKTPYRLVANKEDKELKQEAIQDCIPHKLWMVVRHGTRNPSAAFIEKMNDRLPEIQNLILNNNPEPTQHLRHSDLYAFQKWRTKLRTSDEKKLTHEGEDEMLELAERMQARFPNILRPVYSNTSYYFRYTATHRTKASATFFAAGLFGRQVVKDVWFPKPIKNDPILRFYKLCPRWQQEVKNNPAALSERKRFEESEHMLNIISSVNKMLNLEDELDLDDIYLMYLTCSFETAWNKKKKSPWCSVFSTKTVGGLEFAEDLKYYYRDGYGYEVTYKQACRMLDDAISYFENKLEYPKATVYFTHSGTLLKLLAHLGLYKDQEPLKHTHYSNNSHQWRVSKIDAFGSNLAFVLYKCPSKYKIAVFHQETLMKLPNGEEFTDFSKFKKLYKSECAFNEMCSIS